MRMKHENPQLRQTQRASQLGYSTSTLQRYRNDVNMLSPYRIQPNNTKKRTKKAPNTNLDNFSYRDLDLKGPQMTSNDLVKPNIKSNRRNKNNLKDGSVNQNIEVTDEYLDEILHNNS